MPGPDGAYAKLRAQVDARDAVIADLLAQIADARSALELERPRVNYAIERMDDAAYNAGQTMRKPRYRGL